MTHCYFICATCHLVQVEITYYDLWLHETNIRRKLKQDWYVLSVFHFFSLVRLHIDLKIIFQLKKEKYNNCS